MKKISFLSIVIMVAITFFGSIVRGQLLLQEDLKVEDGYGSRNQSTATWTDEQKQDNNDIVVPLRPPEESNNEESQAPETQEQSSEKKECPKGCCGIKLNTNFPIIGDCIGDKESENPTNAFPTMIGAITKIVMSLVLVVCFIMIIVAGIMRAGDNPKGGKELIKKAAVTILVLGFSGVILRLINPNFFS